MEPRRVVAGRYELRDRLGAGGMGEVFLAQDLMIDRQVAFKFLAPDINERQFLREARAAGRLTHPNIVTIYDIGSEDGRPFIAMEYVQGVPLDKVIRERHVMPLTTRLRLIEQLCDGLEAAHKQGVVHRDIKPSNLMLTNDLQLKIVDFGIATVTDSGLTATNAIAGSLPYMAPEQLAGDGTDARTDLFSATVVAYELLSYQRAFPGGADTAARRLVDTSVPPVSQIVTALGESADALIRWGLNRDPADRPQTAEHLKARFSALRIKLESDTLPRTERVGPLSAPILSGGFLGTSNLDDSDTSTAENRVGAARGRLIAIGALVIVGVAGALWVGGIFRDAPPVAPQTALEGPASSRPTEPKPTSPAAAKGNTQGGRRADPGGTGSVRAGNTTEKAGGATGGESSPVPSNSGSVPQQTDPAPAAGSALNEATPTPSPTPAPTPAGVNAPAPPAALATSDEDLIRKVLEMYSAAFRNRDTSAVKSLNSNMSGPELAALDKTFISSSEYQLRLTDLNISVQGSKARVTCAVFKRIVPLAGETRSIPGRGVFDLVRGPQGWAITLAKIAP